MSTLFFLTPGLTTTINAVILPSTATTTIIPISNIQQVINLKLTNTLFILVHVDEAISDWPRSFLVCRWLDSMLFSARPV